MLIEEQILVKMCGHSKAAKESTPERREEELILSMVDKAQGAADTTCSVSSRRNFQVCLGRCGPF